MDIERSLRRIKRRWEEKYLLPQVRAVLSFAETVGKEEKKKASLIVSLPWQNQQLTYRKRDRKWIRESTSDIGSDADALFIFCLSGQLEAVLGGLGSEATQSRRNQWYSLYRSNVCEVWEKIPIGDRGILPLRFGLNAEEKSLVLRIARRETERFLRRTEESGTNKETPERFKKPMTVGVAYWIGGELRGSHIMKGATLPQAMGAAVCRAACDLRFKPMEPEELAAARIEVTVISPLRMPLMEQELKAKHIDPTKGYRVALGRQEGWYLPEVLNCKMFSGATDFFSCLMVEKAHLSVSRLPDADILSFEVVDIVESVRRGSLTLMGPLVGIAEKTNEEVVNYLRSGLSAAADQLVRNQELDGNIPPIIHTLSGKQKGVDFVRLAFAGLSLAVYGKSTDQKKYFDAAAQALRYVEKHILNHPFLPAEIRLLSRCYSTQGWVLLGERTKARQLFESLIQSERSSMETGMITRLQVATTLVLLAADDSHPEYIKQARDIAKRSLAELAAKRRAGEEIFLVNYAELLHTLRLLQSHDAPLPYRQAIEALTGWYVSLQNAGSFPTSTKNSFAYTRATGKIFEVLALDSERNREALEKSLRWLAAYQYTEDNSYFVPELWRSRILGGFRHDVYNPDVWIDAAGHFLVGGARWLEQERETKNRK